LLGYNVAIPEELEKIIEQKLVKFKCPNFVFDSARILEKNIENTEKNNL